MTGVILGDPIGMVIVVLALGFLFFAGHVHGYLSRDCSPRISSEPEIGEEDASPR